MVLRTNRKVIAGRKERNKSIHEFALLLRNHMTRAEAVFWRHLKKWQKGWTHKFKPQVVIHGYVADFYSDTLKLAVEIDGRVHDRKDVKRRDRLRTRRLVRQGITVVRFKNYQVFSNVHQLMRLLEESAG